MGAVYLVRDPQLGRQVALKTILERGNRKLSERFRREMAILAKFQHPAIVRIYDVGQEGEVHYFTMDFLEGESLAQWRRREKISPPQIAQIMIEVAQALHYAHGEGILHRDLKPANIMITTQGQPVVMDFGLACAQNDALEMSWMNSLSGRRSAALSKSGAFVGTPAYIAPEQAGESGRKSMSGAMPMEWERSCMSS